MAGLLRVGVLASGGGTNLQALLDAVHEREARIVAVATDKADAQALERARAASVPASVFPRDAYPDRAARDAAIADWLLAQGVELIVLAGYMAILDAAFIARFRDRIINVHPSLLPAFTGIGAVQQALDYGVKVFGVTVHFVDEGVDSGAIILQEAFEILPYSRDIAAIENRIHVIEHRLLPRAVKLFAAGAVRVDPESPRHVIVEEVPGGDD
jgi:phosphoribosylglycinamide formyltransferase-1